MGEMMNKIAFAILSCLALCFQARAGSVLFDFDNAPVSTPLPISLTVDGLTANFAATGQGFSVQNYNTTIIQPSGFTGSWLYPSSVVPADLLISFSQTITDF